MDVPENLIELNNDRLSVRDGAVGRKADGARPPSKSVSVTTAVQ